MIDLLSNSQTGSKVTDRRSVGDLLAPLIERSRESASLLHKPMAAFEVDGEEYFVPRFLFLGPQGGAEPIRIGIFAAIHGDEPATASGLVKFVELLDQSPELARDYCLFIYPVCNPTGYGENTRTNRRGRDLNREFWNNSSEPEMQTLQTE